ncbi:hypothetical protein DESC_270057 [Desulfosarcina cetonica]|nr:hypothetical protein DESC_270057 [Desulfosarcina cetonica]
MPSRRGGYLALLGIFKKDVVGGVIGELEVNFPFVRIPDHVQVGIQVPVPITVRPRGVIRSAIGRGKLVDTDEPAHQLITGIDFQYTIGSGPVLNGPADLVLRFLRTPGQQAENNPHPDHHGALHR